MACDCAGIKQRLEKKATFEGALVDLTKWAEAGGADVKQLFPMVSRCYTLLKARYSNVSFWKQGHHLFQACTHLSGLDTLQLQKLKGYLTDAKQFTQEASEAALPPPPREPTLGELLLGLPPPQPAASHLSDAGLVLEEPARAFYMPTAAAAAASVPEDGDEEDPAGAQPVSDVFASENAEAGAAAAEAGLGMPSDLNEALRQLRHLAGQTGEGAGAAAASEQQLLDMLARMAEEFETEANSSSSRPPASKKVVASLPRIILDEQQLQELGTSACCPVCTEDLVLGDEVQKLPCGHIYHIPCLAPWLAQHNSCPTCRHEMPTDDHVYEARKEREAQEAEDRRGADNALSHNEFMYI